jgi:hypothetical protein
MYCNSCSERHTRIDTIEARWLVALETDDQATLDRLRTRLAFRPRPSLRSWRDLDTPGLCVYRHHLHVSLRELIDANRPQNLRDLVFVLREWAHEPDHRERVTLDDERQLTDLPVWGEAPLGGTAGVWSWDTNWVLVGESIYDSRVEPR